MTTCGRREASCREISDSFKKKRRTCREMCGSCRQRNSSCRLKGMKWRGGYGRIWHRSEGQTVRERESPWRPTRPQTRIKAVPRWSMHYVVPAIHQPIPEGAVELPSDPKFLQSNL
ncbi:hypothetical protein Bbelb_200630 [Branchiostoma belcheri]|nr:hypothetical protein Bbelb_200630 [Branchiostoma belcheri]